MSIPIGPLKAKYIEMADLIITDINATTMTLRYNNQGPLVTADPNFDDRPKFLDSYGGKVPLDTIPGRQNESGDNLVQTNQEETIIVRAYWNPKINDIDIKTDSNQEICKVNTFSYHDTKLMNATTAVINGRTVKRVFDPIPYGLFEKRYSISYWQVI